MGLIGECGELMADSHGQKAHRERVEQVAAALSDGERLWLELHARKGRRGRSRWVAIVCRAQDAVAMLQGRSEAGATFEYDDPAGLGPWLEALRVRPAHPLPKDLENLVLFGCEVEVEGASRHP
jgi:hypothetical protein